MISGFQMVGLQPNVPYTVGDWIQNVFGNQMVECIQISNGVWISNNDKMAAILFKTIQNPNKMAVNLFGFWMVWFWNIWDIAKV